MEIFIYDTETTGLIKPSPAGLEKQPSITELFAYVVDENGEILREWESLFHVGFPLDPMLVRKIGISDEMLEGQPTFAENFASLAEFATGCDAIVAHNLDFDRNMLANELLRIDKVLNFPWPRHHICTVEASMKYKGYRLTLTKLHKHLFNVEFSGAHRARSDVTALTRCFNEMVNRGTIDLNNL